MLDAMRVDGDDLAVAVEHRSARRPGGRWRRVLDRPGDAPPAWPAKAVVGAGDLAPGRPQPLAAGGDDDDDVALAGRLVGPRQRLRRRPCRRRGRRDRRRGRYRCTVACAVRPSAKRTDVVRSRRLWALVTTRPAATTKPLPRPWRPTDTTDGPAADVAVRTRSVSSVEGVHGTPDSCRLANCK